MGKFFSVHVRLGVYDLGGNGPRTGRLGTILAYSGGAFFGSFLGSFLGSFFGSFLIPFWAPKWIPKQTPNRSKRRLRKQVGFQNALGAPAHLSFPFILFDLGANLDLSLIHI